MKTLLRSHWIVVGSIALVFSAVSVICYLIVKANSEYQDSSSVFLETEASNIKGFGELVPANFTSSSDTEVLQEIIEIESTFQRTAALYSLLDEMDDTDLVNVWRQSENVKRNSYRTSIQATIVRKVASIDPAQALSWISDTPRLRRAPLLKGLFHEWSIIDLHESVKGAKSLNGTDRRTALEAIFFTREDLSTSILLDIGRELELENFALRQISSNQTLKLLGEPSSAWDLLVSDNVENTKQLDLFKLVLSAWEESEGFDVLLRAAALFPHKDDRKALSAVIEEVVGVELADVFDYVRNLSVEKQGELPAALAMVATRVDPEIALEEIAAWSDDSIFVQLQKIVSATWAHTDPRGMLEKLELVPQIARAWALELAFTHLAYVSPMEAVQNLKLANKFLSSSALLPAIIAKQWSHTDPDAALEWSISYSGSNSELRERLLMKVFRNLVVSDIDKALEVSGEIHSTYLTVLREATYDVVRKLTYMGKIDDSIALLPQLDKNARYFATEDLGRILVRAGEPYAAVEIGADIPTPDVMVAGPVNYFDQIFQLWATRDPQQLFDSLQSLTSPLLRSLAARTLLHRQNSRPALSKESIEFAEALLSEYPVTKNLHLLELQLQDEKGLIDLDQIVLPPELTE